MEKSLHECGKLARIQNWYKSLVRYKGIVMTRKEWIEKINPTYKTMETQIYSHTKINLEYKKLIKPKITYLIANDECLYEVPKIVWDDLNLSER